MVKKLLIAAVVVWISGFVAALVLVVRWRRLGVSESTVAAEPVVAESSNASVGALRRTTHRFTEPIVAGAKADLHTLRDATRKVSHRQDSTVDAVVASAAN